MFKILKIEELNMLFIFSKHSGDNTEEEKGAYTLILLIIDFFFLGCIFTLFKGSNTYKIIGTIILFIYIILIICSTGKCYFTNTFSCLKNNDIDNDIDNVIDDIENNKENNNII